MRRFKRALPTSGPDDFFKHAFLETCDWAPEAACNYLWNYTGNPRYPNNGIRRITVDRVHDGFVVARFAEFRQKNEHMPVERWIFLASIGKIKRV